MLHPSRLPKFRVVYSKSNYKKHKKVWINNFEINEILDGGDILFQKVCH